MPKTMDDILREASQVIGGVLREPALQLKAETTAKDVKDWDSLNHIMIIVAVEKHFGIKFNFAEVQKFKNVGQMCEAVLKRVNPPA